MNNEKILKKLLFNISFNERKKLNNISIYQSNKDHFYLRYRNDNHNLIILYKLNLENKNNHYILTNEHFNIYQKYKNNLNINDKIFKNILLAKELIQEKLDKNINIILQSINVEDKLDKISKSDNLQENITLSYYPNHDKDNYSYELIIRINKFEMNIDIEFTENKINLVLKKIYYLSPEISYNEIEKIINKLSNYLNKKE